ncbi:MAG: hypothetical protein WD077_05960 [Bacteroidia bacterium]
MKKLLPLLFLAPPNILIAGAPDSIATFIFQEQLKTEYGLIPLMEGFIGKPDTIAIHDCQVEIAAKNKGGIKMYFVKGASTLKLSRIGGPL